MPPPQTRSRGQSPDGGTHRAVGEAPDRHLWHWTAPAQIARPGDHASTRTSAREQTLARCARPAGVAAPRPIETRGLCQRDVAGVRRSRPAGHPSFGSEDARPAESYRASRRCPSRALRGRLLLATSCAYGGERWLRAGDVDHAGSQAHRLEGVLVGADEAGCVRGHGQGVDEQIEHGAGGGREVAAADHGRLDRP
jgi:hypothetical protein